MKNQVLSVEQCKELLSLGVNMENAQFHYIIYRGEKHLVMCDLFSINAHVIKEDKEVIPTFTLQDCLNILRTVRRMLHNGWDCGVVLTVKTTCRWCSVNFTEDSTGYTVREEYNEAPSLLEAAFNMIKWCKLNNYI